MEPRSRGRARGQARGQTQGQPAQRPGQGPPRQPPPQRQPGPPPQGAWGQRAPAPVQVPQQQPPAAGAWGLGRPQVQGGPPAQTVGRGSRQGGDDGGTPTPSMEHAAIITEAGDPGQTGRGGNGGVRGRSNRNEILFTRPQDKESKKGVTGQKIPLMANFFRLVQAGKWTLRQYRVDFSVELDDTRIKKRLMYQAMSGDQTVGGYLFDGTVLYTPHVLNPDPMEKFVTTENGENIRIIVRLIGEVAWGDFHYLQLFNIVIRKCLIELKLQLVGRNYFDPGAKIDKLREYNLELWPGYFTSIRQHESDILMNAEIQFKVMRLDSVFDLLMECRGGNIRQEFQNKVIGSVVLTTYNNKTYRVDDVDFKATPLGTFKKKDGTEISYIQHFKERYNVSVRNKDQPMLVSKSKPREIRAGMPEIVYLVPELCRMTGLTDRQRDNFKLMRALGDISRVGPKERIEKLLNFSRRLTGNPGVMQELRRWDLQFANTLIKFEGRVLPPENILLGNNAKYPVKDADWTRDLRSNAMFTMERLTKLAVICPAKFKQPCQEFMQTLSKAAKGMSWNIGNYRIMDIPDDRSATYLDVIEKIINNDSPNLIMCILPTATSDRYSAIKKKCCVDRGVPTQIILGKNLNAKGVMSIATKVAIQLNCKIGGAPWSVIMPLTNLMVVGYDVCRDTANKSKSFAGMVASLDRQITRYFSAVSEHKYEEELSENFATFIILACKKFYELNGNYPERILIYRDGVGDGQIPFVHSHEVSNIKKRLQEEIYKNNNIKMAFIIVSKRINTRIFYEGRNPPPGTVVDDVITLPERYDFFIVSQCVHQGTVGPTSYNVISDTMGLPPDRMQMLTYKLTHMYYNWSGTVRVPAPCQYAHKLAFLVSQSLHRPAHRNLENVLYYL